MLNRSDKGDAMTADELEGAADELHKTIESLVCGGFGRFHSLVAEATELKGLLREVANKMKVGVLYEV